MTKFTLWLNRQQIAELFDKNVKTIGKHIGNVFSDVELTKFSVVANFATTASDGKLKKSSTIAKFATVRFEALEILGMLK